ncbi:MAG: ABC transporter permease [Gaiella sp.]
MSTTPEGGPPTSSSIFDLGYRRYEGGRTGRAGTLLTLYVHALRSGFGLGRRTSSKIFPFLFAIFAFVPAVIQLGVAAIVSGVDEHIDLFKHEDYFSYVQIVLVLFCATVAPELVGRDQRSRLLTLYFSRSVSRLDYVLAKFAAVISAMLVLTLGPQALLFVGNGMAGDDLAGYLSANVDLVLPILAGSLVLSAAIGAVGLVIAAYLPRRAYATAAIVGSFVLTLAAANILMETADTAIARFSLLVSPLAWDGMIDWFFGVEPGQGDVLGDAGFGGWVYLLASLVMILAGFLLTLVRFRRVSA